MAQSDTSHILLEYKFSVCFIAIAFCTNFWGAFRYYAIWILDFPLILLWGFEQNFSCVNFSVVLYFLEPLPALFQNKNKYLTSHPNTPYLLSDTRKIHSIIWLCKVITSFVWRKFVFHFFLFKMLCLYLFIVF